MITMNKFIATLAALMVALFTVSSFAWDPPHTPKPQSAILDQASALTQDAHSRLDAQLKQINSSSANEIAVLIVPDLAGESIEDVGIHTAKAWGVGKKDLDNGVLVILAMKEHKSRIEVGKGAEGDLPDLKANDILKNVLRPHMRSGDVEGGLSATISSISSTMANHRADVAARGDAASNTATSAPSANNGALCDVSANGVGNDDSSGNLIMLIALSIIGICVFLAARSIMRARREQEELMRKLDEDNDQLTESLRRQRQAAETIRERRKIELKKPTPVVEVPVVPRRQHVAPLEVNRVTHVPPSSAPVVHSTPIAKIATVAVLASELERIEEERQEQVLEAARRRQEEQDEADRRRREREEDDRRRREQEDEDRRRSESSSSSYDSGSSSSYDSGSSGGGFDSGGGFGGGDFGGGGSSGDW